MSLLAGVMILSLTLVGVGYAHWYKIITLEGFINTGVLHLTPYLECYGDNEFDKDVATILVEPPPGYIHHESVVLDSNYLFFAIENAYPCYEAWFCIYLYNDGTIPAGLEQVEIMAGENSPYGYTIVPGMGGGDYSFMLLSDVVPDGSELNDPADPYMAMEVDVYITPDGYEVGEFPLNPDHPNDLFQIDPGMGVWLDVYIHFGECLPQDARFWWLVQMEYRNWNEVTSEWFPMLIYNGQPIDMV
jgi:hypothetical protein